MQHLHYERYTDIKKPNAYKPISYLQALILLCNIHNEYYGEPIIEYRDYIKLKRRASLSNPHRSTVKKRSQRAKSLPLYKMRSAKPQSTKPRITKKKTTSLPKVSTALVMRAPKRTSKGTSKGTSKIPRRRQRTSGPRQANPTMRVGGTRKK
jgi:hypothetical protein